MAKITSELEPIAKLAYELAHKPHLHDVFESTHPQAFKDIVGEEFELERKTGKAREQRNMLS